MIASSHHHHHPVQQQILSNNPVIFTLRISTVSAVAGCSRNLECKFAHVMSQQAPGIPCYQPVLQARTPDWPQHPATGGIIGLLAHLIHVLPFVVLVIILISILVSILVVIAVHVIHIHIAGAIFLRPGRSIQQVRKQHCGYMPGSISHPLIICRAQR